MSYKKHSETTANSGPGFLAIMQFFTEHSFTLGRGQNYSLWVLPPTPTSASLLKPCEWPSCRSNWHFLAQRRFPSIINATCLGIGPACEIRRQMMNASHTLQQLRETFHPKLTGLSQVIKALRKGTGILCFQLNNWVLLHFYFYLCLLSIYYMPSITPGFLYLTFVFLSYKSIRYIVLSSFYR